MMNGIIKSAINKSAINKSAVKAVRLPSRRRKLLLLLATGLLAGTLHTPLLAGSGYRFDQSGYLGDATLMPDWSATMQRQQEQAATLDRCLASAEACPRYYKGLRELLLKARALTPKAQIKLINFYVNRKRYTHDTAEKLDTPLTDEPVRYRSRWATVEEFMRRGGDCEDYATTKYYLLRKLGFDIDSLRVVVTWDRAARGYHALLAVRHEDKVLLLESDNVIRRATSNAYRYIYSLNEKSIWDHETQASVSRQFPAPTYPEQEKPA